MKKRLLSIFYFFSLLSSLIFSNIAFAETEEKETMSPVQFANYLATEQTDADSYRDPSGFFLEQKDNRFLVLSKITATKEDIEENKEFLDKMGFLTDDNLDAYKERSFANHLFVSAETYILIAISIICSIALVAGMTDGFSKGVIKTLVSTLGFLVLMVVYMKQIVIYAILVGGFNYMRIMLIDPNSYLDSLSHHSTATFSDSYLSNARDFTNFALEVAAFEETTEAEILKRNYGRKIKVEVPFFSKKMANSNPSVAELKAYHNECMELDRTEVDTEWEFSFTELNVFNPSVIPTNATILNGGGGKNTNSYECMTKYFGKKYLYAVVNSKIPLITQNFMEKDFNGDNGLTQDTSIRDNFIKMFNGKLDYVNDNLERVSEVASQKATTIPEQIDAAYKAVTAADAKKVSVESTEAYRNLVDYQKKAMKKVFIYNTEEDFTQSELMYFNVILQGQYMHSLLFGFSDIENPLTGKYMYGFDYLKPFLKETVKATHSKICADRFAGNYEMRVRHAQEYNTKPSSESAKNAKPIFGTFDKICFSGYKEDRKLMALGDPLKLKDYERDEAARINAIMIWQKSINEAAFELTTEDFDAFDNVKLDFINNLAPSLYQAANLKNETIEIRNEQNRIYEALDKAFSYEFKYSVDRTLPNSYVTHPRFTSRALSEEDLIEIEDRFKMNRYDYSSLFTFGNTSSIKYPKQQVVDGGDLQDLLTLMGQEDLLKDASAIPECPVVNPDGTCGASINEIIHSEVPNMKSLAVESYVANAFLGMASAGCSTATGMDLGKEKKTSYASGKKAKPTHPLIMAGCGVVQVADATLSPILSFLTLLGAVLYVLMYLVAYLPYIIEILFYLYTFLMITLPIIAIIPILGTDTIKTLGKWVNSGFKDKTFVFDSTKELLILVFSRIISYYFMVYFWIYILTSPHFGAMLLEELWINLPTNIGTIMGFVNKIIILIVLLYVPYKTIAWASSIGDFIIEAMTGKKAQNGMFQEAGMLTTMAGGFLITNMKKQVSRAAETSQERVRGFARETTRTGIQNHREKDDYARREAEKLSQSKRSKN